MSEDRGTKITALRVPKELDERLANLAKSTGRANDYFARVAIADWLERHEGNLLSAADLGRKTKPASTVRSSAGAVSADRGSWANLDIDDDEQVRAFGRAAREIWKTAVSGAVADHKAIGNPVYSSEGGRIIKEEADGRRFEVSVSIDGEERTVREL